MNDGKTSLVRLDTLAAIMSSIAAIAGVFLLIYQLRSDNPDLDVRLRGAAYADYEDQLYIAVWASAFNKGKRPIGILESKLNIIFSDPEILSIDEVAIFPRFGLHPESHSPAIEAPFFFDPTYFDSFIRDQSGKPRAFDYAPRELAYTHRVFETGTYRRGFMIYRLDHEKRKKFINGLKTLRISLALETTGDKILLPITTINRWKKETFGQRFIIVTEVKGK
jgi:hypothetical protein